MSRRVAHNKGKNVKGEVMATSCHVCKAHGKSMHMVESHNFRDVRGKVCCPTMLENVCSKCNQKGHFQSRCEVSTEFKPYKSPMKKTEEYEAKKEKPKEGKATPVNVFAALAEESESEDEAIKNDPPPANVTIRTTLSRAARLRLNWADDSESDEE
jgi:hypothetical protein